MIRIAIVEDDLEQARELSNFLKQYFSQRGFEIDAAHFINADSFLEVFHKRMFSLIFMDIEMPGTDGMTASLKLREIDNEVILIFITNLSQFALKGYEVEAFDYIVKPINYHNFTLKMNRVENSLKKMMGKKLIINTSEGNKVIDISTIKYVEVYGHNIVYHTTSENFFVGYDSIRSIMKKLEAYNFKLCNRSYLVNLKFVTGITLEDVYVGDETLKLARLRRTEFKLALEQYIFNGGEM